jgi:HK97 gp10 family phage protein
MMANSTRVEVSGLKELGAAMSLLGSDIAKKISFAGVLAGANIIKKSAQAKAPIAEAAYIARQKAGDKGVLVQPANIARNIVNKRIKSDLTAEYIVTVRGKRQHGYAANIARLQEFGTVKQSPQPFLRPAYEAEKENAVKAIKDRLEKRIIKANTSK